MWYLIPSTGGIIYVLQRGIFFFSIGAYIKLHENSQEKDNSKRIITWIMGLLVVFVVGGFVAYGLLENILNDSNTTMMQSIIRELLNMINTGVIVPLSSISLFVIFDSINIGRNRTINIIASTAFGVYLLHDNIVSRYLLWNNILHIDSFYKSAVFPVLAILFAIAVYIVLGAIDLLRIRLFESKMNTMAFKILKSFDWVK